MTPFSVVIPAYREEHRLGATLEALVEFIDGRGAEIIVVDDGSDDGTTDVAEKVLARVPRSQLLCFRRNRGKGAAVRAGALVASGEAIIFMDADLASDLGGLDALLGALESADIAIASRTHSESITIGGTTIRKVMAQCFNAMARVAVGTPFDDTQCGFKAFRHDAADRIFPILKSNRFAFDVEVLAIAHGLGLSVVEVPVVWTAIPGTRVRAVDPFEMMLDLVRIGYRCRPRVLARAERHSARQLMGGRQWMGGSSSGLPSW